MITRCPRKVACIKRAFGNRRAAAARQRNPPGTIMRKKRPLLSRLNQAYVSLALNAEAVAEHLVSRAKQLHRADARPAPSS
jgi:hypothetical protein